ncbi:MAG TPA: phage holin family protein [Sphingomonadaceae bacterium]|nr:phage holin family protein [Sphingomonadaceae bacterium]
MDGSPRRMTAQSPDDPVAGPTPREEGRQQDAGASSLFDDLASLIEDGRTYADAEIAYQKTRAAYVGEQAKGLFIAGGIAALLVVLAIVALVLGALLALAPLVGAIGATAIVFGVLLLMAFALVRVARAKAKAMMRAFGSSADDDADGGEWE